MIISDKHKFILVCNPKTASTAMRLAIDTNYKGVHNHEKPAFVIKSKFPGKWDQYLTVGFCRNPYDRMVSIYYDFKNLRHAIGRNLTFEKWLETVTSRMRDKWTYSILKPQYWFLGEDGQPDKIAVKRLGKYENLQEDWKSILGFPPLKLVRNSGHKLYQELYTRESAAIVESIYKDDFRLFNYSFLY